MQSPLEHRIRLNLRWRDLDSLGHVNHAVYHDLLEEARAGLLDKLLADVLAHDMYVLAHVDVDYRAEVLKEHDWVEIVARVSRTGTSSVTLAHEIVRSDGVCAVTGNSVLVAWDSVRRSPRPLATAEIHALNGQV